MKLIKTRLQNSLTEGRLTQLMRIAIESPDQLTEDEIEVILDIGMGNLEEYQGEGGVGELNAVVACIWSIEAAPAGYQLLENSIYMYTK